jgi:hypothetical protein
MVLDAVEDLELHVRQRTHGQRDLLADQARDERRILLAAHAVIDPRDFEDIERLIDIGRRPLLPGVRHGEQAVRARPCKHRRELRGRMTELGGIKPHRADGLAVLEHLIERLHCVRGTQVTQEARDQTMREPEALLRRLERTA